LPGPGWGSFRFLFIPSSLNHWTTAAPHLKVYSCYSNNCQLPIKAIFTVFVSWVCLDSRIRFFLQQL
jgi:hypothetical protein